MLASRKISIICLCIRTNHNSELILVYVWSIFLLSGHIITHRNFCQFIIWVFNMHLFYLCMVFHCTVESWIRLHHKIFHHVGLPGFLTSWKIGIHLHMTWYSYQLAWTCPICSPLWKMIKKYVKQGTVIRRKRAKKLITLLS